jgi:hypothetical protein
MVIDFVTPGFVEQHEAMLLSTRAREVGSAVKRTRARFDVSI